jgi:hypothetical protein
MHNDTLIIKNDQLAVFSTDYRFYIIPLIFHALDTISAMEIQCLLNMLRSPVLSCLNILPTSSQVKPCLVDVCYEAGVGRFTGVWHTSFHPIGFVRNTRSRELYVLVFRLKSECGGRDWRGSQ